jgi:hypothetical protein
MQNCHQRSAHACLGLTGQPTIGGFAVTHVPCPFPAGCFPFDHVDNPDPNSRSAQMEVWAQQVHGRWHDLPAVAAVVNRVSRLWSSCWS